AGERAYGMHNLLDDLIAIARCDRAIEAVLLAVDRHDLVLVVTAVEGRAPRRALMAYGEVDPVVLHLADVDDRRRRDAGGGRRLRTKQQVVRGPLVTVDDEIE